jgi:hypothetical protein
MGIIDYVKEALLAGFKELVKDIERDISRQISFRLDVIRRRIMREIMGVFFILLAIAFLGIALIFFFIEYLGLGKTISFLIVGMIVLFIGLIIKIIK